MIFHASFRRRVETSLTVLKEHGLQIDLSLLGINAVLGQHQRPARESLQHRPQKPGVACAQRMKNSRWRNGARYAGEFDQRPVRVADFPEIGEQGSLRTKARVAPGNLGPGRVTMKKLRSAATIPASSLQYRAIEQRSLGRAFRAAKPFMKP